MITRSLIAASLVALAACGQQAANAQAATLSVSGHAVALPSLTAAHGTSRGATDGAPPRITATPAMPVAAAKP